MVQGTGCDRRSIGLENRPVWSGTRSDRLGVHPPSSVLISINFPSSLSVNMQTGTSGFVGVKARPKPVQPHTILGHRLDAWVVF